MKASHATDREIQEILDGKGDPQVVRHLKTCATCLQTLEFYQAMARHLREEPAYPLSENFAASAASRIIKVSVDRIFSPATEIALIVASVIAAIAAMVFLLDMNSFVTLFSKIRLDQLGLDLSILTPLKDLISGLNGGFALLPFGCLALLLVGIIDRLIQKSKRQKLT